RDPGQDRGHRHGSPRHPRRRLAHAAGALEGQGAGRFRNRAPAVHADLRAALEGLAHDSEKWAPVFGPDHAPEKNLTMDAPPRVRNPQAVLFACGLNSVRSPMAESLLQHMFPGQLYVKSAGVRKGELDPFAVAVMAELGQDISSHKPMTFEELDDWE